MSTEGSIALSWETTSTKGVTHPYVEVEVVGPDELSDYTSKRINIDDSFIKFANQAYQDQAKLKFELKSGDLSEGTDAAKKLVVNGDLEICFHRTLRMPDDNRLHQLPASLGLFPLFNVEQYESHLSKSMTERGGIFFSMWQREAMWIEFTSRAQQYVVRAFIGNVNVISGLPMDAPNDGGNQDYIVVPQQKWIDGICVTPGVVRQFVAMPLGAGYTVEGQMTGEEKLGGLQLEVIPAYRLNLKRWSRTPPAGTPEPEHSYDCGRLRESKTPREEGLQPSDKVRAYPNPPIYHVPLTVSDLLAELPAEGTQVMVGYFRPQLEYGVPITSHDHPGISSAAYPSSMPPHAAYPPSMPNSAAFNPGFRSAAFRKSHSKSKKKIRGVKTTNVEAMGLAAGGKLIQDIVRDSNDPRDWNKQDARLINIHILDPSTFEQITHMVPLPPPMDAKAYTDANLPFYVLQEDVDNRLDGGEFNNVLSVSGMDKKVGVPTEPEFDPFKPKMCLECSSRLCDCIVRPCDHQFCNVCIGKLDDPQVELGPGITWKCPTCASEVAHVAGFSAPMNLPGEEVFKVNVQVNVLKPHGGLLEFQ